MNWPDAVSEGLPPARDDEPEALRRDIVDELTDHLACATSRELRKTDDEAVARQAALERFGDPRRLARRLWFDWMKEKIMTQRITYGVLSIVSAACVAAFVLAWLSFEQTRDLTQQTIALNQAMLTRLEALAAAEPQTNLEWTELTVRCVKGSKDGQPAEGFQVTLNGKAINPSEDVTLSEQIDADGNATFGPIRPGKYYLRIAAPWGLEHTREVVLVPGRPHNEDVVCPTAEPTEANIAFHINWPQELHDRSLLIHCIFHPAAPGFAVSGPGDWYAGPALVTLMASGKVLRGDNSFLSRLPYNPGLKTSYWEDNVTLDERVRWDVGRYELVGLMVLLSETDQTDPSRRILTVVANDSSNSGVQPVYEARPDAVNEWKIDLPAELVDRARKFLQQVEAQKSE